MSPFKAVQNMVSVKWMWYYCVLEECDRFFSDELVYHNDSKRVREKVFQNEPEAIQYKR